MMSCLKATRYTCIDYLTNLLLSPARCNNKPVINDNFSSHPPSVVAGISQYCTELPVIECSVILHRPMVYRTTGVSVCLNISRLFKNKNSNSMKLRNTIRKEPEINDIWPDYQPYLTPGFCHRFTQAYRSKTLNHMK